MKKPKKSAKYLQQKRAKKNAKRKQAKRAKVKKNNELVQMLNKMTPEQIKEYLGEEAYQNLIGELENEDAPEAE